MSVEKMGSLFIILKNCYFCCVTRITNVALLINSLCSATAVMQNYFVNYEKIAYKSKDVVWSLL